MNPEQFQENFVDYLRHYCMVQRGQPILVGFSGGADSTALLELLSRLRETQHFRLHALYVNHGLRPDLEQEVQLVRQRCDLLGVELAVAAVDVGRRRERDHRGLEDAARQERWTALREAQRRLKAHWVAVAHTRTDQAETLLQRLRRGSGLVGACCMAPQRDQIIRPLLWATREELRQYVRDQGLSWCEDETNTDCRFERSRLRHHLLPLVEQDNLITVTDEARRLEALLHPLEEAWLSGPCLWGRDRQALSSEGVRHLSAGWARRLVRRALASLAPGPVALDRAQTRELVQLAQGRRGGQLSLPGLRVERCATRLVVALPPQPPPQAPRRLEGGGLPGGRHYRLDALGLTVTVGGEVPASPIWGIVNEPLGFEVRTRRPGDRLRDSGKKLKSHWERWGLWQPLRDWVPMVVATSGENDVLWTALDPVRRGPGVIVSFCLDRDQPLRRWLRRLRRLPEGRRILRFAGAKKGQA